MKLYSKLMGAFDTHKWWKFYQRANQTKNPILKKYYRLRYTRMTSKSGGYVGVQTVIKERPYLVHGFHGIHITRHAVIGEGLTLHQNVTIGSVNGKGPVIGDNVFVGANAVIVGNITVGNNVKIGAGAVVAENVPDNCTVVGPKARILQK